MYIKSKHYIYETGTKPSTIIPLSCSKRLPQVHEISPPDLDSDVNIIMNKHWIILYIQFSYFLFSAEQYIVDIFATSAHSSPLPVQIYPTAANQSSMDGHLGCFQFFSYYKQCYDEHPQMYIFAYSWDISRGILPICGVFLRKISTGDITCTKAMHILHFRRFPPPALYQCIHPQSHVGENLESV